MGNHSSSDYLRRIMVALCSRGVPAQPPICADTGQPKYPGNCWNVRCQLGGTCCRAAPAHGVPVVDPRAALELAEIGLANAASYEGKLLPEREVASVKAGLAAVRSALGVQEDRNG